MEVAVCDGLKSGAPSRVQGSLVVASSGAGEVFDRVSEELLDFVFCVDDLALQLRLRNIGKVGVGHRMAANFESLGIEVAKLFRGEIAGRSEESRGHIEGGMKIKPAKYGSGGDQVGFAAIVESNADTRLRGILPRGKIQSLAHA